MCAWLTPRITKGCPFGSSTWLPLTRQPVPGSTGLVDELALDIALEVSVELALEPIIIPPEFWLELHSAVEIQLALFSQPQPSGLIVPALVQSGKVALLFQLHCSCATVGTPKNTLHSSNQRSRCCVNAADKNITYSCDKS